MNRYSLHLWWASVLVSTGGGRSLAGWWLVCASDGYASGWGLGVAWLGASGDVSDTANDQRIVQLGASVESVNLEQHGNDRDRHSDVQVGVVQLAANVNDIVAQLVQTVARRDGEAEHEGNA